MREKFKSNILLGLAATLPVACFAACITSTFAWYAYNKTATVLYSGTSVIANKQLQVGIETDVDLTDFGLTTVDGIAWAKPGSSISDSCITYYLTQTKHATNSLSPATSRGYTMGDDLSLYKPVTDEITSNPEKANTQSYVQLPLTFRVIELATNKPVGNKPVWVTATILRGDDYNVQKGLRVHFDDGTNGFIYNPSQKTDSGSTTIGGLLDMDGDDYYEYDYDGYEKIYGDLVSGTPTYEYQVEDSDYDDVNKTGETENTCFYAKHKGGTWKVNNFDSLVFDKAEYYSQQDVIPEYDPGTSLYSEGMPVCVTEDNEEAIGKVTMTVWLEGWDHVVVDRIIDLSFDLNLVFEVNHI